ncbi:hypothetical protein [Fibrella aestuarina]|nr:hypothetical protein [Fibrella aestuarina]
MRLLTYGLLGLLGGLMACSSGKTAYRRGDYAEAVKKASERLRQPKGWGRRGHELAAEVVKRAFVNGYNQHQATIRALSADVQRPFRWEAVFAEYETLQAMSADAQRALQPLAEQQVATDWLANYPTDYTNALAETRQLAAADRYQLAETAFAQRQTDRLAARTAYEQYQAAQKWVPGYQQSAQRSLEAFSFAVLRVLIEPPVPTPELDRDDTWALGQSVNESLVRHTTPSPYVHLYQPDQVEVADNGDYRLFDGQPIHEVVQFAVRNYRPYDESYAKTSRTIESSKLYKVGTKRINDSTVVDILEKIKGTVILHTHRIEARLDLQLRALDARTDAPLWTDSDYVSTDWVGQWETFIGDSRALDSYTLITQTGSIPSSRDLLHSLLNQAGSSVVGTLRKQYKKQ